MARYEVWARNTSNDVFKLLKPQQNGRRYHAYREGIYIGVASASHNHPIIWITKSLVAE